MALPTPFPGMDPYLEHRLLWPGFHTTLMVAMLHQLAPRVRPRYAVSIEVRVVLEAPDPDSDQRVPDLWVQHLRPPESRVPSATANGGGVAVATDTVVDVPTVVEMKMLPVKERYLEVLDLYQDQRVVTVIELLSPSNKRPGPARAAYLEKQQATLASECHLVEIDLLRHGRHTLAVPDFGEGAPAAHGYMVCVSRHPHRPPNWSRFETYPFGLRDRLPRFAVPLADPDPDVPLDLQAAFAQVYEDSSYMIRVKYDEPCVPALDEEDQKWADECWQAYRQAHPEWFGAADQPKDASPGEAQNPEA
jgi:hypothetical protein